MYHILRECVMDKKAVILCSGGLDSTTCLAIAKSEGFECYALSFDYEQRHAIELVAARAVVKQMNVAHKIIKLNLGQFGGSALTDHELDVPMAETTTGIPITYVPARNLVFLSIALAYAETLSAYDIFIGVNAIDYSQYPDCRPEFVQAFQHVANLATKAGVNGQQFSIRAPLLHLSKAEIIKIGLKLGVNYAQTCSCYQPDVHGHPCGVCDSCCLRKRGFTEVGIKDPLEIYT